eukprot:765436-Hanusia_phi.AAC.4
MIGRTLQEWTDLVETTERDVGQARRQQRASRPDSRPMVTCHSVDAIDELLDDLKSKSVFCNSFEDKGQAREAAMDALLQKVDARIERSMSYGRLFGTLIFFLAFVGSLYSQRDISAQHQIEISLLNLLKGTLPDQGSGGYTNSDGGAVGVLQNSQQFYSLFSDLIVQTIFSDPICGDGVCDSPDEFPGFGRFGCSQDCGPYRNITRVQVDLKDIIGTSAETIGGDVSSLPDIVGANKAGFKYNIYSESVQDFLFQEDQNPSVVTFDIPDGKYSLVLYQTQKNLASLDASTFLPYTIVPSTIPTDKAKNDYAFGVRGEVLAWSIILNNALVGFCLYTPYSPCSDLSIPGAST